MKNINKIIRRKIIEITFFSLIIICSFPIWSFENPFLIEDVYASEMDSFVSLKTINFYHYEMYPMSDNQAINYLMPIKLVVSNNTKLNGDYRVSLRLNKVSTISYTSIKYMLDDEVYNGLNLIFEDDNYYYFSIVSGNVVGGEEIHQFKLWLDESSEFNSDTSFIYDFVLFE